jgi:hypothetical protein
VYVVSRSADLAVNHSYGISHSNAWNRGMIGA